MLPRERYLPAPDEDRACWCTVSYVDGGLARKDVLRASGESDEYYDFEERISPDNGRTWSEPRVIEGCTLQLPGGGMVTYPCGWDYEPRLGILYEKRMRRLWPGMKLYTFNWGGEHPFCDHTFVMENGSVEKLLKYEEGPDFDPANPFDSAFCAANRAYLGVGMDFAPDGTAYYPIIGDTSDGEGGTRRGLLLMRRDPSTGAWLPSQPQFISPEWSSRGLQEPDVAALTNGDLLVVCRANNTQTTPDHKWFTVSSDGGRTLRPVEEFRYDDGSSFYSPSSIHAFVRSSRNGRLYWVANIVEEPRNGPRYPLYVSEIDEAKVAVRKDSLVMVDDRRQGEPEGLQLSNFSVLENRETQDIEIYMTRLGEVPGHFWQGAVYRYTFSPPA